MIVNSTNLAIIFDGFNGAFNKGFQGAKTRYRDIAMTVPSSTRSNVYGWLGALPRMREWIGDRIMWNLELNDYTIQNKNFEQTIEVSRNDVEDDQYGVLSPMFSEMGRTAAEMPDELVFNLLAAGFTTKCYDEQNFFDTDHPTKAEDGQTEVSTSNMQAGGGPAWYLLDTSRAVRPLIYQERRRLDQLVRKDQPTDDNVFERNKYIYGSDGRCNVGFGLWQLAHGSKAALDKTNYEAARKSMQKLRGNSGRLLGVMPDTLLVSPDNESAALTLINSEIASGGASNEWKGTAKLIVTPWLS